MLRPPAVTGSQQVRVFWLGFIFVFGFRRLEVFFFAGDEEVLVQKVKFDRIGKKSESGVGHLTDCGWLFQCHPCSWSWQQSAVMKRKRDS